MTPETKARQLIDNKLALAGWVIQDMQQLNLSAGVGVAVREYPTDSGPADYVLFVNRHALGVIEAKKDSAGENLTATEAQTERYANATLKWRKDQGWAKWLPNKSPSREGKVMCSGGSGEIRTHEPLRVAGFQDRCNRPLCHASEP